MEQKKIYFYPDFDKITIAITVIACGLILFAATDLFLKSFSDKSTFSKILDFFSSLFLLATFIGSILLSPQKYILTEKELIIKRMFRPISIPYETISSFREIDLKEIMKNSIRLLGSGGVFGYYGKFSYNGEKVFIYVRRLGRGIFIETKDRKYIIAPQNLENFISEFNKMVKK